MKLQKIIIITAIMAFSIQTTFGQSKSDNTYKFKQMFMYHFLKYIQWPDDASQNDFVIGVVGDKKMYENIKKTFDGGKRKSRTYKIQFFSSIEEAVDTEVLFLGKNESQNFDNLLAKIEGGHTLLITDKNGLGNKGSCINFREQGNKLKFELNMSSLQKAGLKVAGQLTQVAIIL